MRCRADQRQQLEHLCRYITRPAIANERLKRNRAGPVVLQLKGAYKDGTVKFVMSPLESMQCLAALVPRPRLPLIRFHVVLAPNAKWRSQIIPSPPEPATEASTDHAHTESAPARMSWARLLKRVLDIDIEHCPNCGGAFKIIAVIEDPPVIARILTHLAYPPAPPHAPGSDRSVPNDLRAETGYQQNPSPLLALSSSERPNEEHLTRVRPPHRQADREQLGFHQQKGN